MSDFASSDKIRLNGDTMDQDEMKTFRQENKMLLETQTYLSDKLAQYTALFYIEGISAGEYQPRDTVNSTLESERDDHR